VNTQGEFAVLSVLKDSLKKNSLKERPQNQLLQLLESSELSKS
jgi:hypothetical protein